MGEALLICFPENRALTWYKMLHVLHFLHSHRSWPNIENTFVPVTIIPLSLFIYQRFIDPPCYDQVIKKYQPVIAAYIPWKYISSYSIGSSPPYQLLNVSTSYRRHNNKSKHLFNSLHWLVPISSWVKVQGMSSHWYEWTTLIWKWNTPLSFPITNSSMTKFTLTTRETYINPSSHPLCPSSQPL